LDLFYHRYAISESIGLGVDAGVFSLNERNHEEEKGIRYGATLFYDHFRFRLGRNDFKDFSEIVPTIEYENRYANHSYLLSYTRQNALFYTYRLCPYDQEIKADHFSISDYISLKNRTNIWANITFNNYSNSDLETIGQFDYRFYYDNINKDLQYDLALEGYYVMNSSPNDCFYSPNFNDSTLLRVDPDYHFNRYLSAKGMLGAGYSFEAKQFLYKYGLWFYGDPMKNLSYSLGCMQSNSAKSGISGAGYYYRECKADLGYRW
jgi:hypothetical protein